MAAPPFSAPDRGRLKKVGRNDFAYRPDSGFMGTDSFLYQTADGEAYSVAEVIFTVGGSCRLKSEGPDPIVSPLRGRDGSVLSGDSSTGLDIVGAVKDGDRYHLLLQGEGKRESLYRAWSAEKSGQVFNRRSPG